MMEYFIIENNGQQAGPFSLEQLVQKTITPETLVWAQGMKDWTPAWKIAELKTVLETVEAIKANTANKENAEGTSADAAGNNGTEAANFQALYTGIQGFQSTISLPVAVSSDNVSDLMHLLTNECPELMQLSSRWVEHSNLLGLVVSVSPEYTISKETFDAQTAAVNTLIQSWQTALSGQSAYQAELTIYNYIIENCVYSTQADNCQSAYGALIDGQAKCDGRAKALVWGLRSLGIKSSVITGNTHAWVIAHIGDYDYNVDPTYDDNENDGIQQPLCYAYFNIPESAISSDPYPADDFYQRRGYPATVRWDFNFHVQAGLWIYADDPSSSDPASGTALDRARALFVAQAESIWEGGGEGLVMIRFENASDYADAAASYNDWVQSFINMHAAGCNIVSYDFSNQQLLALRLSFY